MKNTLFSGRLLVFLTLPALMLALLTSCEKESASDVNQDKIYADYELFYNANTDKTTAIARFRFGGPTGTLLELDSADYVTFNGDDLPFNALIGAHAKEYAGLLNAGTFSYTNLNNQTFINQVPAFDTIAFPASFDTLYKSQAYTLTWEGTPLAADQNVGLFIGSWTWGQDALYFQDGDGATNLVLGTAQLSGLPVGPSVCYLDRSTDVAVSEGTGEGGRIRGKYRALNRTVQVLE